MEFKINKAILVLEKEVESMNVELQIYKILKDGNYHTSDEFAKILGISDKTVRKKINNMRNILDVDVKKGVGYRLKNNKVDYTDKFNKKVQNTSLDRTNYIISKLITNEYIKIDDLSYELDISNRTISSDIKSIKQNLKKYKLDLKSTPYYGLSICGEEIDIRRYIVRFLEEKLNKNIFHKNIFSEKFNLISKDVLKFIQNNNLVFSDVAYINLVITIYVVFKRIEQGKYLTIFINDSIIYKDSDNIISFITSLNKKYYPKYKLTENEISYILLHFFSKRTFMLSEKRSIEIDELIDEVIKYIDLTYSLKINEELYDNLYKHLVPLAIRLRFNIPFTNPILDEIKENMPFSYNIALYMANILSKKIGCNIAEDEIGYLAVIFEMYIEKNERLDKKRVLIICPLGRGTSKFLEYMYMKLFSEYIECIHTVGVMELKSIDLNKYDLLFTTTKLDVDVGKKVYKVNCFLNEKEINEIRKLFIGDDKAKFFISSDLFVHIDKTVTKDEVIRILCNMIKKHTNTTFPIYQKVLEREKLGFTEILNNIAIPHPMTKDFNFNKVAIAVLDNKIKWDKKFVNIVLLVCINDFDRYSEVIYSNIFNLFCSKEKLEKLQKNPTYSNFMNLLKEGEDTK